MKAMSYTLVIVVSAVVLLVAALVVLTIFGGGVGQVSSIAQAESLCSTQGKTSCMTTGQLPPTWGAKTVKVGDELKSCKEVSNNCDSCSSCGFCADKGESCDKIPCCFPYRCENNVCVG